MEKNLTIKYDGNLDRVNAITLINGLNCIVTIIEETISTYPVEQKIEVQVSSITKGSFNVGLTILADFIQGVTPLLGPDNLSVLSNLFGIIVDLFTLRNFLQGKKPAEVTEQGESVIIKNSEGATVNYTKNVYNLYLNNSITDAINDNFESMQNEADIESFEIIGENNEVKFKVGRAKFAELSYQDKFDEIPKDEEITRKRHLLHVFKVVFDDKYKWDFIYKGSKISANIIDTFFFEKIDQGEKFSKGDILDVDLQIIKKYDPSVNTWIIKEYKVLKVFKHIPRNEQQTLEFPGGTSSPY